MVSAGFLFSVGMADRGLVRALLCCRIASRSCFAPLVWRSSSGNIQVRLAVAVEEAGSDWKCCPVWAGIFFDIVFL